MSQDNCSKRQGGREEGEEKGERRKKREGKGREGEGQFIEHPCNVRCARVAQWLRSQPSAGA